MLPLCRHIKTSGHRCAGIALRGTRFCYHHDHLHIERRSSGLRSQIRTQSPAQTPIPTYDLGTIPVPEAGAPRPSFRDRSIDLPPTP
jgi:hypothetical protein